MPTVTKPFSTSCLALLQSSINANSSIGPQLQYIIQDTATNSSDFIFVSALSPAEDTTLNNVLSSWTCNIQEEADRSFIFFADQLLTPSTSDWAISAFAALSVDTINSNLLVRRFDDTDEEGIGLQFSTPSSFSKVRFIFRSRPQSSQVANRTIPIKVYSRAIPENGTFGSWQSVSLGNISLSAGNTNWRKTELEISISASNFDINSSYFVEITRDATNVVDNLVGDLTLLGVELGVL